LRKIFIDGDIGDDVDSVLALGFAMRCPELSLLGVSTVYGDVARRSQLARKVLDAFGGSAVPVAAGESATLGGEHPVGGVSLAASLSDEERRGVVDPDGIDLLVDAVMAAPGEVTLVATGPLTNVARAIRRRKSLAQALAGLVVVGGDSSGVTAHANFARDSAAAAEVLASGAPVVLVGADAGGRCTLPAERVEAMRESGVDEALLLCDMVRTWGASRATRTPALDDVLAVACCLPEPPVRFREVAVTVETEGEAPGRIAVSEGAGGSAVRLAGEVDADALLDTLQSRLLGRGADSP